MPQQFEISYKELQLLMQQQGSAGVDVINGYGGVQYFCEILHTSQDYGISTFANDLEYRREIFGKNSYDPPPSKTFCHLVREALDDSTLIILELAAVFSLGLHFYKRYMISDKDDATDTGYDWIEGVAILSSVFVVVLVTAFNDYSKEQQFRNLQNRLDTEQTLPVLRDGIIDELPVQQIVVGDICLIKYGDLLPADGVIIQSNDIKTDESSLTGESDLVVKGVDIDPMVLSGTHVMEGSGKIIVIAVGINSQSGIILNLLGLNQKKERKFSKDEQSRRRSMAKQNIEHLKRPRSESRLTQTIKKDEPIEITMDSKSEKSVLQGKLLELGFRIGKAGTFVAVLTVLILYVRFFFKYFGENRSWTTNDLNTLIGYLIIGVSVLVVAVPEGLPLAVTLSLAYSVKKMMNDNNLVRHLDACETMGNATTICSDKTGTLTTNRMSAVQLYTCEKLYRSIPKSRSIPKNVSKLIIEGISINSLYTSKIVYPDRIGEQIKQIGNKTECGLLGLVDEMGGDYEKVRDKFPENKFVNVYTFNSTRKSMSTVIWKSNEKRYRVYTKGASEIVLDKCNFIHNYDGDIQLLDKRMCKRAVRKVIEPMAEYGLRTILIAYRDFIYDGPPMENEVLVDNEPDWENELNIVTNLTFLCIVGIEDPVRPEVPDAIRLCQKAGITVRMVTGDNITTARSIAIKCGIIRPGDDFLVLDGVEFNSRIRNSQGEFSQHLFDRVWPKLRVLARSSPTDKYVLVKGIIDSKINKEREVVAVTGDGTNDGPALKKADVGFAMGIAGTDVAKEACDIIITDDNFHSIVLAVMWGRNVYDSISKFIQFQLTVNIVAVTVAFFGACLIQISPLRAVQLLWVNLIMDTLASLALATEKPTIKILNRQPYGRTKSLISPIMFKNICTQACYQLIVLFTILFSFHKVLGIERGDIGDGHKPNAHFTIIFNTLVMMTLFNEICSRKIHGEKNFFEGLCTNNVFIGIWLITFLLQIFIVQYGQLVFFTVALNVKQWFVCLGFGIGALLWSQLMSYLPFEIWIESCFKMYSNEDNKKNTAHDRRDTITSLTEEQRRNTWLRGTRRLTTQIKVMDGFRSNLEIQKNRRLDHSMSL